MRRGKISRPCGTSARPRRARSCGCSAVMSAPSQRMRPARIGCSPTMARIRLVLPTPLRPSTQVTVPRSAVTLTPAQDVARAVIEVDVLGGEHGVSVRDRLR